MTRLGIVALYDADGKIYSYLEYYLSELRKVVHDMIIVFNGTLQMGERDKLQCFTDRVYERENIGFDAGAYKYALGKCISQEEWETFDEVVLTNDTCFGPLWSFEKIFAQMDQKGDFDFWGMNAIDVGLFRYLQSNFLVIKRAAFDSLIDHFDKCVNEYTNKLHDVCIQFETGLYVRFINDGFRAGSYVEFNDLNPYNASYYLIKDYGCPIFKKKADIAQHKENLLYLIKYTTESTDYDSSLVENYFREKCGIDLSDEILGTLPECIHISYNNINEDVIRRFVNSHEDIYIYGVGNMADYFLLYYKKQISNLRGFIISDDRSGPDIFDQHKVYRISQVEDKSVGIIVALDSKNTSAVRGNLVYYDNVLYLSQ